MDAESARATLRMRCAADVAPFLSEDELALILAGNRLVDANGAWPDAVAWNGAYDMARAEAEAWGVKAAKAAANVDVSTPENRLNHSQVFDHCMAMQRRATLRIMSSVSSAVSSWNARCDP